MHCWATCPLTPHEPGWKLPLRSLSDILLATALRTWPVGLEGTWETRVASEDKRVLAGLLSLSSSLSREQGCGCVYSEVAIPAPAYPGIAGEQCSTVLAKPLVQAHMGPVSACAMAKPPQSLLWNAPGRGSLPTPCHQTQVAAALFPHSRDRHLGCSGSAEEPMADTEGWGDAHTQGDVQGSSLPDSAACSSPKPQPCTCCGAKAMQLLRRKPMAKEQEGGCE